MRSKYVIFDLDDTLTYEIDFLKSAFYEIAVILDSDDSPRLYQQMLDLYYCRENVFEYLCKIYSRYTICNLKEIYQNHFPIINLNEGANELLTNCQALGHKIGLITDGRTVTQRNKLKALEIEEVFNKVIISEEFGSAKPAARNYNAFVEKEIYEYYYIADNPAKDFVTPNALGWQTICLLNAGHNIHRQDFTVAKSYLPHFTVKSLSEISIN